MSAALICDAVRTPIGRYGGALAPVRADDLGAIPIAALLKRNPQLDPAAIEDVVMGCAYPEGATGFNIGRNAAMAAGCPTSTAGMNPSASRSATSMPATSIRMAPRT